MIKNTTFNEKQSIEETNSEFRLSLLTKYQKPVVELIEAISNNNQFDSAEDNDTIFSLKMVIVPETFITVIRPLLAFVSDDCEVQKILDELTWVNNDCKYDPKILELLEIPDIEFYANKLESLEDKAKKTNEIMLKLKLIARDPENQISNFKKYTIRQFMESNKDSFEFYYWKKNSAINIDLMIKILDLTFIVQDKLEDIPSPKITISSPIDQAETNKEKSKAFFIRSKPHSLIIKKKKSTNVSTIRPSLRITAPKNNKSRSISKSTIDSTLKASKKSIELLEDSTDKFDNQFLGQNLSHSLQDLEWTGDSNKETISLPKIKTNVCLKKKFLTPKMTPTKKLLVSKNAYDKYLESVKNQKNVNNFMQHNSKAEKTLDWMKFVDDRGEYVRLRNRNLQNDKKCLNKKNSVGAFGEGMLDNSDDSSSAHYIQTRVYL